MVGVFTVFGLNLDRLAHAQSIDVHLLETLEIFISDRGLLYG